MTHRPFTIEHRCFVVLVFCSIAMPLLYACSGGSDSSSQANDPPGSTPQPTAQVGRFNAPVLGIIPVPNGNGDIYVAGPFTTYNNQPVRPVVRLRPNGTLNDSFKLADTVSSVGSRAQLSTVIAAADDGSGDLYVSSGETYDSGGNGSGTVHVWKVNSAGAIASGFSAGELTLAVPSVFSPGPTLYAIAPVGDGSGRVYLGGIFDLYNGTPVGHLIRLNTNGTIDPAFVPEAGSWVRNILPAKDGTGDLYVMNYGQDGPNQFRSFSVTRRNADGTLDPAFGPFRPIGGGPRQFALVEDGSGDLFVTGGFIRQPENPDIPRPGFVRLNSDGSLDETSPRLNSDGSFDPTSTWPQLIFPYYPTKSTDGTNDWFVVTHPNVLKGGSLDPSEVQRRKADGTRDTTFTAGQASGAIGTEECFRTHGSLCNGINFIMPAPDATGDIYLAGGFTTYNSVPVGHIVRINSNGTLE